MSAIRNGVKHMKKTSSLARLAVWPLLMVLVACGNLFPDDRELVQRAKDYLDERSINAAKIELHNALQKNPDNAEARYLLGKISLSYGDYPTAAKEYRRAAMAGWNQELAATGQAQALLGMGNYKRLLDEIPVRDAYTTATRASLLALRALAESGLGDTEQASKSLAAATGLDPDSAQVLLVTIQIHLANGDRQAAEATLVKALELYPDSRELQLIRVGLSLGGGDTQTVMKLYREIIASDPPRFITSQGRQARLGLARLQLLAGELEAAEETIKPLYWRNWNDPDTNYLGALLAFEQGDYDLAEERVLKVLQWAPEHSPTHLLFGTIKFAQADYDQAIYYLSRYLASSPENSSARKLLGRTYMRLGQHEEARKNFQQAADENPDDAELIALVGLSELRSGATAAGLASLEKAVASAPENPLLRSELAKAYISAGQAEHAIRELNLLVKDDTADEQYSLLLVAAYLRDGQHDQAINLALKILKRHPDDPGLLAMTGNVFAVSGDAGEARSYFTRALRISPHDLQATMMLAQLEEQDGNADRAVRLYKGLIAAGEKSAEPLLALARLAREQDHTDEMLDWLDKARVHDPRNINSRIILADYYLNARQPDRARPLIDEAARIATRQQEILALQGRLMLAEKDYKGALLPFGRLVTRYPDSAYGRVLFAESYRQLRQYDDARRQLDIALEQQPWYLPALLQKAKLETQAGKFDAALDYSRRAIKADPESYAGYELAGNAWMGKQDHAAAGRAYAQAWARQQAPGLVLKLSRALAGSGNYAKAASRLEQWLADHADDVQARELLGTVYQQQGENGKAVAVYEKVLSIEPGSPVALNNLAWLYIAEGNPGALQLAERAHRAKPDDAGIKDTYGWILVQSGEAERGRELLAEAIEALPDVPEVQYHYAVALMKSGKEAEGRRRLRELVDEGTPFEGRDAAVRLSGMP